MIYFIAVERISYFNINYKSWKPQAWESAPHANHGHKKVAKLRHATSLKPIAMAPILRGLVPRATGLRSTTAPPLYRPQHLPRALSSRSHSRLSTPPPKVFPGHHHHPSCPIGTNQQRSLSSTRSAYAEPTEPTSSSALSALPVCCPGCGAYAQIVDPDELGYYSEGRRRKFSIEREKDPENLEQDAETTDELRIEGELAAGTIEKALRDAEEKGKKAPPPKRT